MVVTQVTPVASQNKPHVWQAARVWQARVAPCLLPVMFIAPISLDLGSGTRLRGSNPSPLQALGVGGRGGAGPEGWHQPTSGGPEPSSL